MKKLIGGLMAVGAVLALRPVVKRRVVAKMRAHCKQLTGQVAGSDATAHEAMGPEAMRQRMREHCGQMVAKHQERSEPLATA